MRFAKEGAKVVVAEIDSKEGKETVDLIKATEGEAFFIQVDITRTDDAKKMIDSAIEKYGRLDVLFNNAGIELTGKVEDMTEANWDKLLGINLKAIFLCCKYAVPEMLKQGEGAILNTSSIAGLFGLSNEGAYCASKGGIIAFTKALAMDYAPRNIRVNCICPGPTATRLTPYRPAIIEKIPVGRLGKPDEIAAAALFLVSNESSFVTGHALLVDGGFTAGYKLDQTF
jgi:NAD(P)-dependent dehydrogenase (short-subunit alcohol dehydrogenase family)